MGKLYEEVLEIMEKRIASSEWPIGYKLPREVDLCNEFNVSRTTIRRALSALAAKERLQRIKGTGSFIIQPKIIDSTTLFIDSFAEELKERGQSVTTRILEFHPLHADEYIAKNMEINVGEEIIKLSRLRYAAERFTQGPIMITTSYFPYDIGKILMKYDMEKCSVRQLCRENGIIRAHTIKHLSATNLPSMECRLLGSNDDDIFFSIYTRIYDIKSRCIEYVESFYPVDRNEFTITTVSQFSQVNQNSYEHR